MQSMFHHNKNAGFTLVELVVIAPIVVLAIGGFIALMVALIGDVLVTQERSNLNYGTQETLDRIERDVTRSSTFLATTGNLTVPQGLNNTSSAFTSDSALILSSAATTSDPLSNTAKPIYYADRPNACGSANVSQNEQLKVQVVYFVSSNSLWRRVIVPDYNTSAADTICSSDGLPWQRNSCAKSNQGTGRCQNEDALVLQSLTTFGITYLTSPASTSPLASTAAETAKAITVNLQVNKTSAGENVISQNSRLITK